MTNSQTTNKMGCAFKYIKKCEIDSAARINFLFPFDEDRYLAEDTRRILNNLILQIYTYMELIHQFHWKSLSDDSCV